MEVLTDSASSKCDSAGRRLLKTFILFPIFFTLIVSTRLAPAAGWDLTQLERSITAEPVYESGSPRYGLLVFGPEMQTRVWLVHDGSSLYVDRNANGDLTEAGEKVAADSDRSDRDGGVYTFEAGEIVDGNAIHKDVTLSVINIDRLRDRDSQAKQLLTEDPKVRAYRLKLDAEMSGWKGTGIGGRVSHVASRDVKGFLVFADKPKDAPTIHVAGPWQITVYSRHKLTVGRELDLVLSFGTPGLGAGTTAFVGYEGVVPPDVFPSVEIAYPAAAGEEPFKEFYELKERC